MNSSLQTLQLQRPFTVYSLFRYQDTVTNLVAQTEEHVFMVENY